MMRKLFNALIACATVMFAASSCTAQTTQRTETKSKTENMKTDGKKLIVFFSYTAENYNVGNISKGNTHIIAEMIVDATGADIFEIVPVKEYPGSYNECIEVAKIEKQANAKPAIKGDVKIEDYDVILLERISS